MLIHSCLVVSSEDNAISVFEDILNLQRKYSFPISSEIMNALFDVDIPANAIVYDCGNATLEVFVIPQIHTFSTPAFHHVCISVNHRDSVLRRAGESNLHVRRFQQGDRDVAFIIDRDGNRLEIKEQEPS